MNNATPAGPKPRGRRKKIRTEPIRPICPQCEKQFSNQSALTKHKLTHSDERKFACQQCSKAFKRHDHLTGHMQTHSNRKPFNCTIQGCDKTYCDARSLRRHKENIHHIVTPKEGNGGGTSGSSSSSSSCSSINNNGIINSHQQHHQNSSDYQQITCISSSTTVTTANIATGNQQPSQLLRRRFHRLHSDPGGQFDYEPGLVLGPTNGHDVQNAYPISGGGGGVHQHHSLNHHHHPQTQLLPLQQQHHQQAPYSADYATTQHFFDLNQMAPMEQQYCNGGSMPHSADSLSDSSLGLSAHYEQQQPMTPANHAHPQHNTQQNSGFVTPTTLHPPTPTAMHPPTPTMLAPQHPTTTQYGPNKHQNYQPAPEMNPVGYTSVGSTAVHNQPSQLLRKRIERFRSTPAAPLPDLTCKPIETNRRSADIINHHHQQQHASYSADYASTQHFSFDFSHQMAPLADQQYSTFKSEGSTGTMPPNSADSMADSSIELSAHYEQQTTTPNHHHHSGYMTPITPNTHLSSTISPHRKDDCQSDKNYCDARSLSSHEEDIHHTIKPQESSGDATSGGSGSTHNNSMNSHQQTGHQNSSDHQPTTCNSITAIDSTTSNQQQQPSHLLRRRIQRLHSDPGTQFDHEPGLMLGPANTNPQQSPYPIGDTNQHGLNHHNQQQHLQAPYSADYATSQHFFDLNQTTPMEQQYCNGESMPHSADSLNDSSLGLSSHYEQQQPMTPNQSLTQQNSGFVTPTTLHPPTPTMLAPQQAVPASYGSNEHQNYQQLETRAASGGCSTNRESIAVQHQPSQLLRKRIQRLRSNQGAPVPDLTCPPIEINRRSADIINHHHQQQYASYSADYASTQHFSFDFNHQVTPAITMDQQYSNFKGAGSTGTLPPGSADSMADSSIELSAQYEQQTMTPNHHHHSGYMTPITPNTHFSSTISHEDECQKNSDISMKLFYQKLI